MDIVVHKIDFRNTSIAKKSIKWTLLMVFYWWEVI